MATGNLVKRIQDVMRDDKGVNGDAQRIEQMTWIFFLKVYDAKEDQWEFEEDNYHSIIPDNLRWKNWAVDNKDGKALTGDDLLNFVNNELFPALKNLEIGIETPLKQRIVKYLRATLTDVEPTGHLILRDSEGTLRRYAFKEVKWTL